MKTTTQSRIVLLPFLLTHLPHDYNFITQSQEMLIQFLRSRFRSKNRNALVMFPRHQHHSVSVVISHDMFSSHKNTLENDITTYIQVLNLNTMAYLIKFIGCIVVWESNETFLKRLTGVLCNSISIIYVGWFSEMRMLLTAATICFLRSSIMKKMTPLVYALKGAVLVALSCAASDKKKKKKPRNSRKRMYSIT